MTFDSVALACGGELDAARPVWKCFIESPMAQLFGADEPNLNIAYCCDVRRAFDETTDTNALHVDREQIL